MIGKPQFDRGDTVRFSVEMNGQVCKLTGTVYIIDAYGTFFDDSDVSYDIYVESMQTLFKHVTEKDLRLVAKKGK